MSDISISIIDREGEAHKIAAPTDMAMNLMEVCKAFELPVEGTCGGMALVPLVNVIFYLITI